MSEDVDLIQVARILKSNGTDGELLISFRDIAPEDIDTQEPVFIYCDGLPVPFFITAFAQRGRNRALVKFADVNSFDDAEEICGQAVYVNAEDYSDLDTSSLCLPRRSYTEIRYANSSLSSRFAGCLSGVRFRCAKIRGIVFFQCPT